MPNTDEARRGQRILRAIPDPARIRTATAAAPGAPRVVWGIGQIAGLLGCSRETARSWYAATRARAGDRAAAAAADALPAPLILGTTTGLAGLTEVGGVVEPWQDRSGAQAGFDPAEIAAWALSTGNALPADDHLVRPPAPMYLDPPAPARPLTRTIDDLLDLQLPGTLGRSPVHVRIWSGPVAGSGAAVERIVVLLGVSLDAASAHPARHATAIVDQVVARGLLTLGQARAALWFATTTGSPAESTELPAHHRSVHYISFAVDQTAPDDGPFGPPAEDHLATWQNHRTDRRATRPDLTRPVILSATMTDLEELIGDPVETYPDGTYTTAIITRFTAGERPVRIDHDPDRLAADLTHLEVLERTRSVPITAHTGSVLSAAARHIAAHADQCLNSGSLTPPAAFGNGGVVELRLPEVTDADEARIADHRPDAWPRTDGIGTLIRDRDTVAALVDDPGVTPPSVPEVAHLYIGAPEPAAIRAALAHAADLIDAEYRARIPSHLAEHQTLPTRVMIPADPGPDDDVAGYLNTISRFGPKPQHRDLAAMLEGLFHDYELTTPPVYGYDPFGRLIVHLPGAAAFAVAWPVNDSLTAAGLDPGPHDPTPRFDRLPDGSLDLIPRRIRLDTQQVGADNLGAW